MKIHLKKFLLSFVVTVIFIFYAIYQRGGNGNADSGGNAIADPTPGISGSGGVQTSTQSQTHTQTSGGIYKDGQYTGNSADAYYGNVQVMVTIGGGKITDVQFLDHPSDRNTSVMINNYAMPILKSEAIRAQSAHVDTVSGATDTSNAFIDSLSSALSQA